MLVHDMKYDSVFNSKYTVSSVTTISIAPSYKGKSLSS
jgi:hypothetical protein